MNSSDPRIRSLSLGPSVLTGILCAAFGANAVAVKMCLAGMGSFTLAASRFTVAATALTIWALLTGRRIRPKPGQLRQMLLVCSLFAVQTALFFFAMSKTSASRSTLLLNLQPFFVLLFAHWMIPGDQITVHKLVGVAFGFVGIASLFGDINALTGDVLLGDILIAIDVVLWALNAVYIKRIIADYTPFQITVYPMYFMIPLVGAAAWLLEKPVDPAQIDTSILLAFVYQSLLTGTFGFVTWNVMQKKYGVVATHSFLFIMPISGVFLGGWLLSEPIYNWNILLALAFIVLGIIIVQLQPKPAKASPPLSPSSSRQRQ